MKLADSFDFTQSNLQDYVECPYRFYLRHVLHTKWPALIVDDALEYEQRRPERRTVPPPDPAISPGGFRRAID